jgi:acyl dehydratase
MDESLIDDAARAMLGVELDRAQGVVVQRDFQRFAASVGDHNPLYFDREYAQANGYPDLVMPPMYLQQVPSGVVDLEQLRPDGISAASSGSGTLSLSKCPRRMAGGEDIRFYASLHPGDIITAVRRLGAIEQKTGRSGRFVVMSFVTTYTRGVDEVVAEATKTVIARPAAGKGN